MIDLHCHILPGIDDGAKDLVIALKMAAAAVEDGVTITACTPHIFPGMYENTAAQIRSAISAFQAELDQRDIHLKLVMGADVHLTPDIVEGLRTGIIPTLNDGRYFLLEPPHHVAPPKLEETIFNIMAAGYVPVITHPERLTWIESHYPIFVRLVQRGVWMQVTAGAVCGRFGSRPKYWAERMLLEGYVHLVASDAHDEKHRRPGLSEARDTIAKLIGLEEALNLVMVRPAAILQNAPPDEVPLRQGQGRRSKKLGWTHALARAMKRVTG